VQVADFNGDGYADIAGRTLDSGQWWVGVSDGTQFNTTLWTTWSPAVSWVNVQAANINTDSATDLVGQVAGVGEWYAALSQAPANSNEGFIGDQLLNEVAQTASTSGDAGAAAQYAKQLTFDSQDRVNLNVRATLPQFVPSLKANLEALSMDVETVNTTDSLISGYLSPSQIDSLPNLLHFASATANIRPILRAGKVPSEGPPIILANSFSASTGLNGAGQTIGIISDTANQYNGGLAESYSVGALNASKVNVLQDGPASGATDEGRAMMETAYDIAPGANLDFYTAGASPADMATAITSLAAGGSTSIADDVGFDDEPYFNDGLIAQAVDQVAAKGVFYDTAAGNTANQAFSAPWKSVTGMALGQPATFFDFGGPNIYQDFTVPTGGTVDIDLQWDDAFLEGGSSLPNFTVPTNLYAYVTTPTGTLVQSFTSNSQNTGESMQDVYFTNTSTTTNFALVIQLASGPAPGVIRWINQSESNDPMATGEGAPTTYGHVVATGAVASGAVDYVNPTTPESFSALGGKIPILFNVNGKRLATPDIRDKPDLVAADDVDVSLDIGGGAADTDGDGWPNFSGTSATAGQVAAAAALIRQENPTATGAQIVQHFKSTTKVIGTPGFDTTSGAGLLQVTPFPPTSPPPAPPPPASPPPPPPGTVGGTGGSPGGAPTAPPIISGPADDQFEPNDTSDTATNFGELIGTQTQTSLTLNGHLVSGHPVYDQDWYRWTMGAPGTFTATLSNIQASGGVFQERIFALMPDNSLQLLGTSPLTAATTQTVSATVSAGQSIFLWVYGVSFTPGSEPVGYYNFSVSLQ